MMRRQQVGLQESSSAAKLIGRTFRQDSCHANARRPVRRPSWAPGGPSGGRLGRQEARRRPSWAPGGPSAGRLGRQEPRIVGFADSSSEIVGFAQSAGRAQAAGRGSSTRKTANPPTRTGQLLYRYVRLICAFHMCINMCKTICADPIDYESN